AFTLTAAYFQAILTYTPVFPNAQRLTPNALSWPHFAFLAGQAAVFWLLIGYLLRRAKLPDLAAPLLTLAGGIALLSGVLGVLTVQTRGEGRWTILALGWAGAVWFGLWLQEQG